MTLLTIGAFAKASRLSPKALRLYDELGLLTPARVDPVTGYRLYAPEQLERARLVAWLRRLGMPLARIQHIGTLDAAAAAQEVRAFWAQAEADTAARRDLATFLIDHLNRKDPAMSPTVKPLGIRYAALSDTGLVRESNQDTAYAGPRLLAVADGWGSHGAPAGAAAIEALKQLETEGVPAGNLLNVLEDVIEQAGQAVHDAAGGDSAPEDTGTTLTAMLWTGSQLALVHIGDSRVYLLRDGELFQITHDHTMVQSMVDDGRLSPEEAASTLSGRCWSGLWAEEPTPPRTCASTTHGRKTGTCSAPTACRPPCRPRTSTGCSPGPPSPRRPYANASHSPTAPAVPTTSAASSPTCWNSSSRGEQRRARDCRGPWKPRTQ